ncbi:MAG: A24 family peptidase [Synergistaceae bacterium]|jgi:leader peptidase (prepilin peptidase)/N-methyltransferase|nr:A24 family peptidase [Synergistaceae bacterium]
MGHVYSIGIITLFFVFAAGACAGSFINAAAMRTVAEKKWWGNERSACDSCGKTLSAADLVPVVSYLALKGKCRYCKHPIKPRHFAAELISGAFTAALFWRWGFGPAFGMSLLVLWFSLFNSLTDIENGFIYDVWAISLGAAGLAARIAGGWPALLDGVLGGALGFGFIAVIILVSRGGMGWGDALLMLGIGGALGWKYCAFGLYAGFLFGGLVVVPLMLAKKLKRKDAIPLGPFLAAGSVVTLFVGNALILRYGALIGSRLGWPWG